MNARTSARGMAGDPEPDPFATLAVGLNEDAKAARLKAKDDDGEDAGPSPVTEALVDLAKAVTMASASIVDDIFHAMFEQFKHRPKPFGQMTADEQSDLIAALRESALEIGTKAIKTLAADDRPHVNAKVKSIGADGSKTKLILEVKDETAEDIADIYRVLTKEVVVILADSSDHMSSKFDVDELIQPDQNAMSFDAEENAADANGPNGNDDDLAQ